MEFLRWLESALYASFQQFLKQSWCQKYCCAFLWSTSMRPSAAAGGGVFSLLGNGLQRCIDLPCQTPCPLTAQVTLHSPRQTGVIQDCLTLTPTSLKPISPLSSHFALGVGWIQCTALVPKLCCSKIKIIRPNTAQIQLCGVKPTGFSGSIIKAMFYFFIFGRLTSFSPKLVTYLRKLRFH